VDPCRGRVMRESTQSCSRNVLSVGAMLGNGPKQKSVYINHPVPGWSTGMKQGDLASTGLVVDTERLKRAQDRHHSHECLSVAQIISHASEIVSLASQGDSCIETGTPPGVAWV